MLKSGGELRRGANNGRWKGGLIERTCLHCGVKFSVKPSKLNHGRGNFCSRSCGTSFQKGELHRRWQGNDLEITCLNCGKVFKVRPHKRDQQVCSISCHMILQRKSGAFNISPNIPESKLIAIIEQLKLPFKYVGDGNVWLGNHNPDFINTNGKKQVIEFMGTYWHPLFDGTQRIEHYKQYGFDCLIIWEDELKDIDKVIEKVKKYGKSSAKRSCATSL